MRTLPSQWYRYCPPHSSPPTLLPNRQASYCRFDPVNILLVWRQQRLQIGQRQDVVAIDRLKPAIIATDTSAAQPPRCGRPPILQGPHNPPKTPKKSVIFQQPVSWSSTELPPPPPSPHQPRQPPDNSGLSASGGSPVAAAKTTINVVVVKNYILVAYYIVCDAVV